MNTYLCIVLYPTHCDPQARGPVESFFAAKTDQGVCRVPYCTLYTGFACLMTHPEFDWCEDAAVGDPVVWVAVEM